MGKKKEKAPRKYCLPKEQLEILRFIRNVYRTQKYLTQVKGQAESQGLSMLAALEHNLNGQTESFIKGRLTIGKDEHYVVNVDEGFVTVEKKPEGGVKNSKDNGEQNTGAPENAPENKTG